MHSTASSALARKIRLRSDDSDSHRSVKSSSATPPSGTVIGRASDEVPSFHAIDAVGAGRHVLDAVAPLAVGHREERMAEDEDEGVHVRVDVAEHAHDAGPIEADRPRVAGRVAPEIERRVFESENTLW